MIMIDDHSLIGHHQASGRCSRASRAAQSVAQMLVAGMLVHDARTAGVLQLAGTSCDSVDCMIMEYQ